MPPRTRRYWDSVCFIGWLAEEPDKVDACRGVIRAAERGELVIVTSSLTLAEVVKVRKQQPLDPSIREQVRSFFLNNYIVVRQLDRFLAEQARDLFWDYGIAPKDGVHVATAFAAGVVQLDTFDGPLIDQSGKIGDPPLVIGKPAVAEQLTIDNAMTMDASDDAADALELFADEAESPGGTV